MEIPDHHNPNVAICMVIPWYGPLPAYFPLFLESLYGQPFDVRLVTDQEILAPVPPNLTIIQLSFSDLKRHFESVLGMPLNIPLPYKLCDFKPAFGLLFSHLLQPYRFWGTIDIDMVVGNTASYFKAERLDSLDFFSGLKYYVAGSFFFMRNTPANNKLFMNSRSWQDVMIRPDMVSFTECNKYWHQLTAGANLLSLKTPIESFTEVLLKERELGMRVQFENIVLEPKGMQAVAVKENGIFYQNKEHLLLHLLYFKTRQKFTWNLRHNSPPYYINSFGTFRHNPAGLGFWLAPNWMMALYRKIMIQWKKLFPPKIIRENAT